MENVSTPVVTDGQVDTGTSKPALAITHVIKGRVEKAADVAHDMGYVRLTTPEIDIDTLVWSRTEPMPALELKFAEILDVLGALSEELRNDTHGLVNETLARVRDISPLGPDVLERSYQQLWRTFEPSAVKFQVEQELGSVDVLDGWRTVRRVDGSISKVRAFPARMMHILPGTAPIPAAQTIVRGAVTRSVNLMKMASNDPVTASTLLEALGLVAPEHPLTRSFSSVYWRGGSTALEDAIIRSQYFDKIVAWGGDSAIRTAQRYLTPGLELVSFDPKSSISVVGAEAFATPEALAESAAAGAADSTMFNQDSCGASRFHFVEGDTDAADAYCAELARNLGGGHATASEHWPPTPSGLRTEIDNLRVLEPMFRVWGDYEGSGVVVRSEDPVDFFPTAKTVNVVPIGSLGEAARYINVATQTVGVYPAARREEVRDVYASAGAQRIVTLGRANGSGVGMPRDGFYPLQRMIRWIRDDD